MISNQSVHEFIIKLDSLVIKLRTEYPNHKLLSKISKFYQNVIVKWLECEMDKTNIGGMYNEEIMNDILDWMNIINKNLKNNNKSLQENNMKKSQLKLLIKEVIKELHQTRQSSSDVYEGYTVYLGNIAIPGISTEDDEVEVNTSIEYESEKAEPASGMFGPPENSSPGHGASIDIIDYWATDVIVYSREKKEYDYETLQPKQKQVITDVLISCVESSEDKIKQDIMDKLGSEEPYYPEPEERDEI